MKTPIALGLLLMASLLSAQAQTVTTFGVPDCGQWLKQNSAVRKAWLMGFLTGQSAAWDRFGQKGDPLGKLNSAEQAYVWMDNYCKTNPLNSVAEGGYELFSELIARDRK